MPTRSETAAALTTLFDSLLAERPAEAEDRWMTLSEAAEYVGVKDAATLRSWIGAGDLRFGRAGREYRLRRSDIDAYLLRHELEGAPAPASGGPSRIAESILKSVGM